MKLKEIYIKGFRGFNGERTLFLHDRLTLIAAPNSHGKTSISEGLEWLLYGQTSKVELADSKDEYRGSYRNIHFLQPEAPTIKATVIDQGREKVLQATLSGSDAVLRVDGNVVPTWPFAAELVQSSKPFILQHALKDLLLAAPVDRFNRFAVLLGFEALTQVHRDLLAFCTRPPLPNAARALLADIDGLIVRVESDPDLNLIAKSIKKGRPQLAATRELIRQQARKYVARTTRDEDLTDAVSKRKDDAIAKVFKGSVSISAFTATESNLLGSHEEEIARLVTSDLVTHFGALIQHATHHKIVRGARFFELGIALLEESPTVCPFCAQQIGGDAREHVRERHTELAGRLKASEQFEKAQGTVDALLRSVDQHVSEFYKLTGGRAKALLEAQQFLPQLETLLAAKHSEDLATIRAALRDIEPAVAALIEAGKAVRIARAIDSARQQPVVDMKTVEKLAQAVGGYLAAGRTAQGVIGTFAPSLDSAQKALLDELNAAAGTRTLSLIIELLDNDRKLERRMRIAAVLDELKGLKAGVDAFVTSVMLNAISSELAADVMDWYRRIRTQGDPDVHFAGFDMKKTAQGGRVQIKAASYGKDLVSAVSSLSESKLNALGLCISIAINLKDASLFEFLIIDDPIQSWDKEHEIQFITVIRELIDRGKQIILLSHNGEWIRHVRSACADVNGLYYEITGYTEDGPVILSLPWVEPEQRLKTILAIVEDQTADTIRLQQAEEELRQAVHQFACTLYERVKGTKKNPESLNADKLKKLLTECGCELRFVNEIVSLFNSVDPAHHAAANYAPNRQKLRQHYDVAVRLANHVKSAQPNQKGVKVMPASKSA